MRTLLVFVLLWALFDSIQGFNWPANVVCEKWVKYGSSHCGEQTGRLVLDNTSEHSLESCFDLCRNYCDDTGEKTCERVNYYEDDEGGRTCCLFDNNIGTGAAGVLNDFTEYGFHSAECDNHTEMSFPGPTGTHAYFMMMMAPPITTYDNAHWPWDIPADIPDLPEELQIRLTDLQKCEEYCRDYPQDPDSNGNTCFLCTIEDEKCYIMTNKPNACSEPEPCEPASLSLSLKSRRGPARRGTLKNHCVSPNVRKVYLVTDTPSYAVIPWQHSDSTENMNTMDHLTTIRKCKTDDVTLIGTNITLSPADNQMDSVGQCITRCGDSSDCVAFTWPFDKTRHDIHAPNDPPCTLYSTIPRPKVYDDGIMITRHLFHKYIYCEDVHAHNSIPLGDNHNITTIDGQRWDVYKGFQGFQGASQQSLPGISPEACIDLCSEEADFVCWAVEIIDEKIAGSDANDENYPDGAYTCKLYGPLEAYSVLWYYNPDAHPELEFWVKWAMGK